MNNLSNSGQDQSKPSPDKRATKRPAKDKRDNQGKKAKVSKDLEGFQIGINAFGEISSNFPVERINTFLNTHVSDRRLNEAAEDSELPSAPDSALAPE
ncbi:MAG: hypothetical protein GC205_11745 [Bacteroidetes bacterium]|nr:hypothetical protein [Bacteroidota bacterium]